MTLAGLRVDLEFLVREGEDDWGNLSAWTGTTPAIIQMKLSGWKKTMPENYYIFPAFSGETSRLTTGVRLNKGWWITAG